MRELNSFIQYTESLNQAIINNTRNIKEIKGFRTDCDDFFKYEIAEIGQNKHTTPFIYFANKNVEAIFYTKELLSKTKDKGNDLILKTWFSKGNTDIFVFSIYALKKYIKKNNIII
jgi:hypothetical protein